MTKPQAFRRQAEADLDLFLVLEQRDDVLACHVLHCLHMATEKLAKAILYASERDFRTHSHALFTILLRYLIQERVRVAEVLGYGRPPQLRAILQGLLPLAHAVEALHPQVRRSDDTAAEDAPNVEYPWKHGPETWLPPADHPFALLSQLRHTRRGSQLVDLTGRLINRFDTLFP